MAFGIQDADVVVGRGDELGRIEAFLDRLEDGPRALVLEGEAGIGKTTLWRAAAAAARSGGSVVLAAAPAPDERTLGFAGLSDLLEPVLGRVLPELPEPQREALGVALQLSAPGARLVEPLAIASAFRNCVRRLSEEGCVVIAIDDVQWLDAPTAAVVAYAVRRAPAAGIGLLLSVRRDPRGADTLELQRALPPGSVERVEVRELSLGALHHIVSERLDLTLPRPILRRLAEASGGNPFYTLELARAVQRRGGVPPTLDGALAPELHQLVGERLDALSARARRLVRAAAMLTAPTSSLLEAAAEDALPALDEAIEANILLLDRDRVRFVHPLLRAGALAGEPPGRRRELHRRLAEIVTDPEERVRHLAGAAAGPDAAVADELERAAARSLERGAPEVSAELLDLSLTLTPGQAEIERYRRSVACARAYYQAGHAARARELLTEAASASPDAALRAQALVELAAVITYVDGPRAATLILDRAFKEPGAEQTTLAAAHADLARNLFLLREDLPRAEHHAQLAATLGQQLEDGVRRARCRVPRLFVHLALGRDDTEEALTHALELQDDMADQRVIHQPVYDVAILRLWQDRLDESLAVSHELRERALARGDESSMPYILGHLSLAQSLAGDLTEAAASAREGYDSARQAATRAEEGFLLAVLALAQAYLGEEEPCRRAAARAGELSASRGLKIGVICAQSALGILGVSLGAPDLVVAQLQPLHAELVAGGTRHPGSLRFVPDLAEALVRLGDLDGAREIIEPYEAAATRLNLPAAHACALRCRGLIAAADGDASGAFAAFDAALAQHQCRRLPIERARTLLAFGAAQRRAKQQRAARATLAQALATFDRAGARQFAAQARAELEAVPGRRAAGAELTPSERRVAELVAAGRTNREVAADLFLAERTVEGHLSRVYSKLGIRSRSELARMFVEP